MDTTLTINNHEFFASKTELKNAPLLIIYNKTGFLACGYVDINTCNKLGDVAAIVRGVNTFDEMLDANVAELSEKAKEVLQKQNVKLQLTGREFLVRISKK